MASINRATSTQHRPPTRDVATAAAALMSLALMPLSAWANASSQWHTPRSEQITQLGPWLLAGMLGLIALFIVLRGRVELDAKRSRSTIARWSLFDRALHWYTAGLFIVLALTGLGLLYGPALLIPYIGEERFTLYADGVATLHDYLGPFFAAGLVLELGKWLGHNLPRAADVVWLLRGGGYIGSAHSSAWRMNTGEKLWFWLVFWLGLATVGAGLMLSYPDYGQSRTAMLIAYMVHLAGGITLSGVALGHIYLGLYGTEGALQGMTTGRVDAEWAKQHHDLWYRRLLAEGERPLALPPDNASSQR
ncbi:MAG: formate dehydrogenase subunit gamma [Gammaproteobacteria bacterium]